MTAGTERDRRKREGTSGPTAARAALDRAREARRAGALQSSTAPYPGTSSEGTITPSSRRLLSYLKLLPTGGRRRFESQRGQASTFNFSIPERAPARLA